jgi:ABC-type lipoprotein export system ATPase subunit
MTAAGFTVDGLKPTVPGASADAGGWAGPVVDLSAAAGALTCVTGRSGAGKSLVLGALYGLLPWDAGTVRLPGGRTGAAGAAWQPSWKEMAYVPQSIGLPASLYVADVFALAGGDDEGWVAEVTGRLGLAALVGRRCSALSLGQQQRVAVGRAAVARPQVVLADEPTSHQDGGHGTAVLDVLAACGAAVVLGVHRLPDHPVAVPGLALDGGASGR